MSDFVLLRFDPPIEGEATHIEHVGDIDIVKFAMKVARAADVRMLQGDTLGSAPAVTFGMSKKTDSASAEMFRACLEGTRFTSATIFVLRNTSHGTRRAFEITLEKVVIDEMGLETESDARSRGVERFSLIAARMKGAAEYKEFTWDFLANRA